MFEILRMLVPLSLRMDLTPILTEAFGLEGIRPQQVRIARTMHGDTLCQLHLWGHGKRF